MVREDFTPRQIINKLREAESRYNQGISIASHPDDFATSDHLYQWYHCHNILI